MGMTNRERLLAILDRQSPDRIPWIPRLQLWYNARRAEGTLPERFRGMSLRQVEHALRLGTPARDGHVFAERYEGMEVRVEDANLGNALDGQRISPGGLADCLRCRRFVEAEGGHIWVDSVEGEGSTFHFTVPATVGATSNGDMEQVA